VSDSGHFDDLFGKCVFALVARRGDKLSGRSLPGCWQTSESPRVNECNVRFICTKPCLSIAEWEQNGGLRIPLGLVSFVQGKGHIEGHLSRSLNNRSYKSTRFALVLGCSVAELASD
jgi:hypothetical protein